MVDYLKDLVSVAQQLADADETRNRLICAAYAEGEKQGEIANAVGLSRMQVSRIING